MVPTLIACSLLFGCAGKPLTIEKAPMSLSTKYIEDETDPSKAIHPDNEAETKWSLGCKTDVTFDITEKDLIDPDYVVTIKPKTLKVSLDAPVTIFRSKNASKEIIDHENAHVQICERVYAKAEKVAEQAAVKVLGRTFQASGKTAEEACAKAVETISSEIGEEYHLRTVEEINRVSEVLDDLEKEMPGNPTHQELVDLAFTKYRELDGK